MRCIIFMVWYWMPIAAHNSNAPSTKELTMKLEGKIALVTGGRGGIGRAVVKRLIDEGAFVYAADLTEQGSLQQHNEDSSHFVKLDVTREQDAIDVFNTIKEQHEKLHILVNAAGIEIEKTIEQTTLDEWNQSFAVNATGTFLTSKYSLPCLLYTSPSPRDRTRSRMPSSA